MKKYIKKFYYQNVKPNIDKVMSNPVNFILSGNPILGAVGSYFYRPDFDARKAKTKDEAYEMARSTGAKTFIWNGGHYNTDYKGDPKKTLVQQKQEELDTYGITNEQTGNRNIIENRILNNLLPYGYNEVPKRIYTAVVKNEKEPDRIKVDKELDQHESRFDLFNLLLHKPQQNNTLGISKYKPSTGSEQNYYYKLNNNEDIDLNNIAQNHNPKEIKENRAQNKERLQRINEYLNKHPSEKNDEFIQLGMSMINEEENIYKAREKSKNNSYSYNTALRTNDLGIHTIGVTPNYNSYYDKWDINPFGSGNDKQIYQFGKPLNIYDREYSKKQGGNINYTSQFKLGGSAKILQTGGTSPNPWRKVSGSFNGVNYQGEVFSDKSKTDPSLGYVIYKDNNGKKFSRDLEGVITYDPKSTTQDSIAFQSILNNNGFNYGKGPATQSLDLLNSKMKEMKDDPWFKEKGQKK